MSEQMSRKQRKSIQAAKTDKSTAIVASVESQFSGPIPPPEYLQGYESIQPGAADRILRMAEKQSEHRQSQEKLRLKFEARDSLLGIIFAFVLCIVFIVSGAVIIVMVPDGKLAGTFITSIGFAPIVTSFLVNTRGENKKNNERESK